jgi:hypothetical protein
MALTAPSAVLTGSTIASSFDQLLFLDAASGLTEATLKVVSTEVGKSALQISDEHVLIKGVDTSNAAAFAVHTTAGALVLGVAADTPAVTVGVDDTGADVRVYSATTNEGLHYDASEDELGLLLTTKLKFHDIGGGEEIYASANGHLEVNAGTTLDITAPTVDINASTKCNIDGALDVVQTVTTSASTPKTIFLDSNTSGVAAQDSTAMHVDFDRTVAGSGTAAHNDIGINLDVNSASLGTSSVIGMDIDVVGATSGTHTATGLTVDVGSSDTNYAALFNGGNVGIGTSSPDKPLDVYGASGVQLSVGDRDTTGSDHEGGIEITGYSTTEDVSIGNISFREATQGSFALIKGLSGGAVNKAKLSFWTGNAGAPAQRMVIDETGKVGIGTTGPSSMFHVNGISLLSSMMINADADNNTFATSSNGSGSTTMYIGNQTITTSSDVRIKENIVDTEIDALAKLKDLRVVDFNWDDPTDTSFNNKNARGKWTGLIAQEVIEHIPYVVNAVRDEKTLEPIPDAKQFDRDGNELEEDCLWGLEYDKLVPVLVKAVQELSAKVTALENA